MKRAIWSCSQLSAAGHVTEPNLAKGQSKTSLISRLSHGQSASALFCQVPSPPTPTPPSALKIFMATIFISNFPCVSYVSSFHLVLKSQPTKTRLCKMFLFSIFLCVNFPKRPFKKENYKVRYIKGCQIHHEYCNKAIHLKFLSVFLSTLTEHILAADMKGGF